MNFAFFFILRKASQVYEQTVKPIFSVFLTIETLLFNFLIAIIIIAGGAKGAAINYFQLTTVYIRSNTPSDLVQIAFYVCVSSKLKMSITHANAQYAITILSCTCTERHNTQGRD